MKAVSIRVNLRFGPRTDPELMREIAALPAYRRARLLRELLEQAWRRRHESRTAPTPASASLRQDEPQPVAQADVSFSEDVLSLFGKSVRL